MHRTEQEVSVLSKKKRRYVKMQKKAERRKAISCGKDTHHIFFQKRTYSGEALIALRDYWYCRAEIPKSTLHRRIHSLIHTVPVPKIANAKSALNQLRTLERYEIIHEEDSFERRLEVLIALFDSVEQSTADALKKQLDIVHKFKKPS